MKNTLRLVCLVGIMICITTQVFALSLVDTGQPPEKDRMSSGGPGLMSWQWLAIEFTIDQSYILTDIQGFFGYDTGGTLTLAIYQDGGLIPDVSQEIFHQTFSIPTGTDPDWYGLTGLDWALPEAGEYWLAFEVRDGDTYEGYMPDGAPNPLTHTSFSGGADTSYRPDSYGPLTIGVRIAGEPQGGVTPVPEPGTFILVGLSLLGLFGFGIQRKCRKK